VVYKGRTEGMNKYKERLAIEDKGHRTLADAVAGADVFYGLSVADVLKPEMVKTMAERPIIFAMANPDPEIKYELAKEPARFDCGDRPLRLSQPGQQRARLPVHLPRRAGCPRPGHQRGMKFAASQALYKLTKEDVPDSVLRAYGVESMKFGVEYIIPKPLDPRVLLWEAPAVAQTAMETGVARKKIDIDEYREQLAFRQGQGQRVRYFIMNKARASKATKRLVFGEGEETKIIRAPPRCSTRASPGPILIGRPDIISEKIKLLSLNFKPEVVDPDRFDRLEKYSEAYYELRQRKGLTLAHANKMIHDPNVLGPMMVKMGDADAFVSGLTYEYPEVIRPALQIHKTAQGTTGPPGCTS
jgi:malate dehydrogenase (oxaloacetate-decarboxylating)(NADP+)